MASVLAALFSRRTAPAIEAAVRRHGGFDDEECRKTEVEDPLERSHVRGPSAVARDRDLVGV